jgi:hypothetical protein
MRAVKGRLGHSFEELYRELGSLVRPSSTHGATWRFSNIRFSWGYSARMVAVG